MDQSNVLWLNSAGNQNAINPGDNLANKNFGVRRA